MIVYVCTKNMTTQTIIVITKIMFIWLKNVEKIENINFFSKVMQWLSTGKIDYCCIRFPKKPQAAVTNKRSRLVSATGRQLERNSPVRLI